MSETTAAARNLITDRLRDLGAETQQLERALMGLGAEHSRPLAPKPRRKRSAGKRGRRSQAPRGKRREQLLAAIKAKPGVRPSELASEIGVSPSQVHSLIAKARAEKLVVKEGAGYALKE